MPSIPESRLALHDAKIERALNELREARLTWAHYPTTASIEAEQAAERRLNDLLDRRRALADHVTADTMVTG